MHPRMKLDISAADLAFALRACAFPSSTTAAARSLEQRWNGGDALACLSVRSGFDCLLSELALPEGSEVLMSAVTIPDMPRLVRHHGLVPVPVDLDLETMAPRLDDLAKACTSKSRVLVVAHLFGGRVDLAPFVAFARSRDLLLVEDCAQAFRSPEETGHPDADVSMFSFGSIKTMTALGGALFRVKDYALRERMRAREAEWPVMPVGEFLQKVMKLSALAAATEPLAYELLAQACRLSGTELDDVVGPAVKGFPLPEVSGPDAEAIKGRALAERVRRRAPGPMLALLEHRLKWFDPRTVSRRAAAGEAVREALPKGVFLPGRRAMERTHWLCPVNVPDPKETVRALRALGFDASTCTSSIHAIPAPAGRPEVRPTNAEWMFRSLIFLPVVSTLTTEEVRRMLDGLAPTVRAELVPAYAG